MGARDDGNGRPIEFGGGAGSREVVDSATVVKIVLMAAALLCALLFGTPGIFLVVAVWMALVSMHL